MYYSLSLLLLKAYAKKYLPFSANIQILNFSINDTNHYILRKILQEEPDIVGFSNMHHSSSKTSILSYLIKEIRPKTIIVHGGSEISLFKKTFLKNNPMIDFVVENEGEKTFTDLLVAIKEGKSCFDEISGLCWQRDGKIVRNPPEILVEKMKLNYLDIIPSPYLMGLVNINDIQNFALLEASRGCLFKCSFCCESRWYGKVYYYSEDRVCEELLYLMKNNVRAIEFLDTSFVLDKVRAHHILEFIIQHNRNTVFFSEMILSRLDDELIDLLVRANFKAIETGLQSIESKTLKDINRPFLVASDKKKIDKMKEKELYIFVDVMAGLPGETIEDFKRSLDYVFEIDEDTFSIIPVLFLTKILPGSALYEKREEYHLISNKEPPFDLFCSKDLSIYGVERILCIGFAFIILQFNIPNFYIFVIKTLSSSLSLSPSTLLERMGNYLQKHPFYSKIYSITNFWEFQGNLILESYLSLRQHNIPLDFFFQYISEEPIKTKSLVRRTVSTLKAAFAAEDILNKFPTQPWFLRIKLSYLISRYNLRFSPSTVS